VSEPNLTIGLAWLAALAEQRDEAQDVPHPDVLQILLLAAERRAWPAKIDGDLAEILGMAEHATGPIARLLRATGAEIGRQLEAEHAFVMHWMLGLWFEHGPGWRLAAGEAIRDAQAKRKGAAA
jgi:hypothetical protein